MALAEIKDIVTICAATIAAYVALRGLHTWKRQLKGQSQYDLCRRLLIKTFKVRDTIQSVRNTSMYYSKEDSHKDQLLSSQQKEYSKRLALLDSAWSELQVELLEAEVLWGDEVKDVFKPMQECRGTLVASIWLYFWLKGAYADMASVDNNPERVAQNDRIVFFHSNDPEKDEFTGELLNAISKIEDFIKPKLKI